MQHKTIKDLQNVAAVFQDQTQTVMTRSERLERWAELLERDPTRRLNSLTGTEYQPEDIRDRMRGNSSPVSVAFDDPMLRSAGLAGDSYGEAKRFFALTDHQLHNIVCYCHHGVTMTAATAARHVRAAVDGAAKSRWWAWAE